MKRSLLLLRHARAFEKLNDQKDIDRELHSVGLQNATRMGINFEKKKLQFDIILTSPAARAKKTAELVAEQIKFDVAKIHTNPEIYEASVRTLLQVINNLKNEWTKVLLVGHNPAISYLAEYITNAEVGNIDTCGVVSIEFNKQKWSEISEGSGDLISYEYPDLLNF